MELVPCCKEAGKQHGAASSTERRETDRQENKHTEEEKNNTTMMTHNTKRDSTLHTHYTVQGHAVCVTALRHLQYNTQ